jgi:hypothetical protein
MVRHPLDHGHVMADEQVGNPHRLLQFKHEIEHPGAHGDIESGHAFIGNDQLRLECQCACNADALALATGEFVRIAA